MRDEEGERDDRPADEGRVEAAGKWGGGGGHGGAGGGGRGVVKKKLERRNEGTEEGRRDGVINMLVGDVEIKGRRSSAGC